MPRPACLRYQQDVLDDHAPLGGGVGAVVDGGEGGLGAGPGVHGVEVVQQRLHGLVGGPLGLLGRPFSTAKACRLVQIPIPLQFGQIRGRSRAAVLLSAVRCMPESFTPVSGSDLLRSVFGRFPSAAPRRSRRGPAGSRLSRGQVFGATAFCVGLGHAEEP